MRTAIFLNTIKQFGIRFVQRYIYPLRWFWIVFCVGVVIRAWTVQHTVLINPDGALYIHQAKAILSGHWEDLTSCSLSYVSIYPILIAGAQLLIRDWILSAQAVSFAFSAATLIPLYFLCRRFFDDPVAGLTLIVAALSPVMCSRSGDVVRGPIYWFFLSLAIYQTIRYWEDRRSLFRLSIAAIAFMLAAWARIEAVVLMAFTFMAILLLGKRDLWKRVVGYGWPLLLLGLGLIVAIIAYEIPMHRTLRLDTIADRSAGFIQTYQHVSSSIGDMAKGDISDRMRFFLPEAQNSIWLIALGTVLNRTLEAFFYPFVLFFVIGLWRYPKLQARDSRWRYLMLASVAAYLLLYIHVLQTWILEYRFMMLVMLPGLPFAGSGIQWVLNALQTKWPSARWMALVLAVVMITIALPKNFQSRDPDKITFRRIAERARSQIPAEKPVFISSSVHTHRVLSLYANKDLNDPPCPRANSKFKWSKYADDLDRMINALKAKNIQFFLYEEKNWPETGFRFKGALARDDFILIGQWYHRDTGQLQLYQISK